ncbi:hypothetical protein VPH35_023187 [Triticum aestivum]
MCRPYPASTGRSCKQNANAIREKYISKLPTTPQTLKLTRWRGYGLQICSGCRIVPTTSCVATRYNINVTI